MIWLAIAIWWRYGISGQIFGERRGRSSETIRAFVFVDVLGGFTTFSGFGLDTFNLIRDGRLLASVNAIGPLSVGVAALYCGYALIAR